MMNTRSDARARTRSLAQESWFDFGTSGSRTTSLDEMNGGGSSGSVGLKNSSADRDTGQSAPAEHRALLVTNSELMIC